MEVIYKYELDVLDRQTIEMPALATILCIQEQGGKGQIWARVNPANELVPRVFETYGTGHELRGDTCCYVGTYQVAEGRLVFHVFESHTQKPD